MKKVNDIQEALLIKIQALYDIESQLDKAVPKLAKASSDEGLKECFSGHIEETKNHTTRLEKVFELMGSKPKKLTSEGIKGIIEDGDWVTKVEAPKPVKDLMIAGAARYAEHYEIAGYMSAIVMAQALGMSEAVELLNQTLGEEQGADDTLEEVMENLAEGDPDEDDNKAEAM